MKRTILSLLCMLFVPITLAAKEVKVRHHPVGGVSGWYLVWLNDDTSSEAFPGIVQGLSSTYGLNVTTQWKWFKGFLAQAPIAAVERLADDPRVARIEQDHLGEAPPAVSEVIYTDPATAGADLWFLDRLDEISWLEHDGTYNMCPVGGAESVQGGSGANAGIVSALR